MAEDAQGLDILLKTAQKNWRAREDSREKANELYINTVSRTPDGALDRLVHLEQSGAVDVSSIKSGNEYPTLFTRLPIFIPSKRRTQFNIMDNNTGVEFKCAFGSGVRKGPPLTTFDEDVFMALIRLRQRRIKGPRSSLPLAKSAGTESVEVDHLICRTRDIMGFLGMNDGGQNYRDVVTSVKNLAATTIELEKRIVDRYFGSLKQGRSLRLFELSWCLGDDEGVFEIQFEPVLTRWLAREYTFVNWNVRKQLRSPLAKSVHRYLSSQPERHDTMLNRLASAVGYIGTPKNVKGKFKLALIELQDVGFLKAWEITGTGRLEPFVVKTWR